MDWSKKLNDELFLKDIRDEAAKASEQFHKESGPYSIYEFDNDAINNMEIASNDIIQKIRDEIDSYQKKCIENFELHCICEIAIRYIDILLAKKGEQNE